jgi:ABC-type uncharacterized transport system substrate-binding protein
MPVLSVMHPLYKLSYFKEANWEKEWINIAEDAARTFFEEHYLTKVENDNQTVETSGKSKVNLLHWF